MFSRLGAKLARYLLSAGNLSTEDSVLLTSVILDKLGALPFKEIIGMDENQNLIIKGRPINLEEAKKIRLSAEMATQNTALNLILEQVTFLGVTEGFSKAQTSQQIIWGRAGVWITQNIKSALDTLAGKESMV